MNNSLCFLGIILVAWACQQTPVSSVQNAEQSVLPSTQSASTFQLHPIAAQVYQAAIDPVATTAIERLCEGSKGYRQNEWSGLNECHWAIEQQLLESDRDRASRSGDLLSLRLNKGETLALRHQKEEVFYEYKGYLAPVDQYLVLIHQTDHCPAFWLIQADNGQKQRIEGIPYFSKDGHTAMVTTTPNAKAACNSQLELWAFEEGVLRQQQTYFTKDRITQKLFWTNNKEVLLRQRVANTQQYTEHYARVEL
ncbi:MAG: hypothetical protein AAGD05_17915 [Bacteroidota bacterium]